MRTLVALGLTLATAAPAWAAGDPGAAPGMPQLDTTTYATQLFWLFVTFGILYVLMSRVALPKVQSVVERRQSAIQADLAAAQEARRQAESLRAEAEAALSQARDEASLLVKAAAEKASREAMLAEQELGRALAAEAEAAERRIAAAQAEALANVRSIAIEVATSATERLVGFTPYQDGVTQAVDRALARPN
ncbi:MAG: F0F1 ATP synthase subunit B' [Alphaproteobacteria bacterium]|nr:F0F1 ATP synthase subunit B' [Alphaproteobacteria bacterium]TAD90105.1 MAG: F0F1 ATP synthase subunit B' [Alphaproteobacteria bacterium]